jgi:hypothetical protein
MTFEQVFTKMLVDAENTGKKYSAATVRAAATAWNMVAIAMANGGLDDCISLETDNEGRIHDLRSISIKEFGERVVNNLPSPDQVKPAETSEPETPKPVKPLKPAKPANLADKEPAETDAEEELQAITAEPEVELDEDEDDGGEK